MKKESSSAFAVIGSFRPRPLSGDLSADFRTTEASTYVERGVVLGVPVDLVVDALAVSDLGVLAGGPDHPAGILVVLERQRLTLAAVEDLGDVAVRRQPVTPLATLQQGL